jgi:hypothetical protein
MSKHKGISPAEEGWSIANDNEMYLVAALICIVLTHPFNGSHIVLLWFHVMMMLRFLPGIPAFAPPPPLLLFALNLPSRLAATSDQSMVNGNSLLLHHGI